MSDKFLGVGLINAVGISVLAMLVSIFLKIIFTKYEVEGLSELVRAAQSWKGGKNHATYVDSVFLVTVVFVNVYDNGYDLSNQKDFTKNKHSDCERDCKRGLRKRGF